MIHLNQILPGNIISKTTNLLVLLRDHDYPPEESLNTFLEAVVRWASASLRESALLKPDCASGTFCNIQVGSKAPFRT